jgi:hypothetical protein
MILQKEHEFRLRWKDNLQVIILIGNLEEKENNNNTSKSKDRYQRLVISLDLIIENTDFISL